MEETIKEALYEGEKVLWQGKPESFETLDKTHKKPFIRRAVIASAIAAALMVAYIIYGTANGADVKSGLIVFILGCAGYGVLNPILTAAQLRKACYVITDQRLMIVRSGVTFACYDKINIAVIRNDADGHSTLLCGGDALKEKPTAWRADTVLGARKDTESGMCTCLAMYAINDAHMVKDILKPYLVVN